jgi:hypothetical protein
MPIKLRHTFYEDLKNDESTLDAVQATQGGRYDP